MTETFVHESAYVDDGAVLEEGSKVWHFCHVRSQAIIRKNVSLGRDVYVDSGVEIGEGTHVQNGVSIYSGVKVGKWCFIGPHVIFTNDNNPRAGNKSWTRVETILESGAAIGAGAIIRCGIRLGSYSMVGAGAIVTKSIAPFQLVVGFPARATYSVCACGQNFFPLETPIRNLLGDCCQANMNPDSFLEARRVVKQLTSHTETPRVFENVEDTRSL